MQRRHRSVSWKNNFFRRALLAQWLERAAVNRKVTGSIPVGSADCFAFRLALCFETANWKLGSDSV